MSRRTDTTPLRGAIQAAGFSPYPIGYNSSNCLQTGRSSPMTPGLRAQGSGKGFDLDFPEGADGFLDCGGVVLAVVGDGVVGRCGDI